MSEDPHVDARVRNQASAWFARLSRRAVTTQTLQDFRDWIRSPENARAYAEVEALWRGAGRLLSDPELRQATGQALDRLAPAQRARPRRAAGSAWVCLGVVALAVTVVVALAQGPRAIRR